MPTKQIIPSVAPANQKSLGLIVEASRKPPRKKLKPKIVSKYVGVKKTSGPVQ